MKNRLKMTLVSLILIFTCTFTVVMPAFAIDDIDSRGTLAMENGNVEFCGEDIEALDSKVSALSLELSDEARSHYESDLSEGFHNYVSVSGEAIREVLKSRGVINYDSGRVVFDSSDLFKLADEIDNLNDGYKYEVISALNAINTYFKEDGAITHEQTDGAVLPENASKLKFSDICAGILKSQSVEHLADRNIAAASEANLSEGSAAWVDGKLIIGNGADNKNSYNEGYEDGYTNGLEEGKAGNMGVSCYYLGTSRIGRLEGKSTYLVNLLVPEVDYTQLTNANFIVCPYKIETGSSNESKYLSTASNVTTYCKILESDMSSVEMNYNSESGRLTIIKPTITANGGLASLSGFAKSVTTEIDVCVYLIIGEIEERILEPSFGEIEI